MTEDQKNNGDYGLYITGGKNAFKGKVTAGYLTTGEGDSVNIFEGDVKLTDEDRDPGGYPLTGHSIGIIAGTNTFQGSVAGNDKDALFLNSTDTFVTDNDNEVSSLDNFANFTIGYDRAKYAAIIDGADDPAISALKNSSTTMIFGSEATKNSEIRIEAKVVVAQGATVEARSNVSIGGTNPAVPYYGTLHILDNAKYTGKMKTSAGGIFIGDDEQADGRFSGTVSFDGAVKTMSTGDISGTGSTTFNDTLTIDKTGATNVNYSTLFVTGGTNTFKGAVKTGTFETSVLDTATPASLYSKNTFESTVTLNEEIEGVAGYAMSLKSGENIFEKAVDTGGKSVQMIASTNTFDDALDAGAGIVRIGFDSSVLDTVAGLTPGEKAVYTAFFEGKNAETILSTAKSNLIAGRVDVLNNGTLTVRDNAKITGNLNFKSGSTFAIDAANTLTVSGATDIEDGAMANVQNASGADSIGNVVLTSGSFTGGDFTNTGLYAVAKDGNNLKITGMNKVEDVLNNAGILKRNSNGNWIQRRK